MNVTQSINKKDLIYQQLKAEIISGKYPPDTRFPKEVDFAKQLGVGRITLRYALERLLDNGMILRIPGKGTFISPASVKSSTSPTIMTIRGAEGGFESPYNYIVPEIVRLAGNKDCKTLSMTATTLLMFSSDDIKSYVKKNNVIGIVAIMNGFCGDEPIISKLRDAGIPVVIAHCAITDPEVTGFAGIFIDEQKSWEAAVAYLSACGHKNIGMLGYSKARDKFRGFTKQECMKLISKYGANSEESWVVAIDFDKEAIKKSVQKMFSGNTTPTAILCYSDFFAIYVYETLKAMKLKIPEDVAVMGTCGYPDARLLSPPLSTVDYEYSKFAAMAVEMLQNPGQWFPNSKGKLREKTFKIRKRKSTKTGDIS
ncbi:MAG: GntR family transcriptional regulator [Victivallaceae bacterium]|nr:GntR family transcriptional regulator [Victivallaceae bacterium]